MICTTTKGQNVGLRSVFTADVTTPVAIPATGPARAVARTVPVVSRNSGRGGAAAAAGGGRNGGGATASAGAERARLIAAAGGIRTSRQTDTASAPERVAQKIDIGL